LQDPSATFDRSLYWHYPHYHAGGDSPYSAVRAGPWKLIEFHEDDSTELYNLADDLGETTNLAAQQPERAAQLRADLHAWRDEVDAQMPTPNPKYDPAKETTVGGGGRQRGGAEE
jgi:arylsulfatase A